MLITVDGSLTLSSLQRIPDSYTVNCGWSQAILPITLRCTLRTVTRTPCSKDNLFNAVTDMSLWSMVSAAISLCASCTSFHCGTQELHICRAVALPATRSQWLWILQVGSHTSD